MARMDEAASFDPKGLVREAFRMEIGDAEARSIFVDWALSLPAGTDEAMALRALLAQYEAAAPDHPMAAVLREGLERDATPRRRGGASGRRPAG